MLLNTKILPYLVLAILALSIQRVPAAQLFSPKDRAEGDAFYKSAFAAYDNGDLPRAHDLLNRAEKLKPDQADGWNLRGAVYMKQGVYDKAETAFSRAVALDPSLWAAQFNHAEVAFRAKKYPVARNRFDSLVSQTNRFKDKNQWELAEYKAFLSSLQMNDDAGAQKRFAKLPAIGGVTPAYTYAQAAIAFRRRDAAAAQKALAAAQATYSTGLNNLFADSLEGLGWQAPNLLAGPALAAAGMPLPSGVGPAGPVRPAYVIDPKLEAAAAEPLPAPDPAMRNRGGNLPIMNASPSDALLMPSPSLSRPAATPAPAPTSALERGTLLD